MIEHVLTKIRANFELGWSLHRGGPLEHLNQQNDRTEKPEIGKIGCESAMMRRHQPIYITENIRKIN